MTAGDAGKWLVVAGIVVAAVGGLLLLASRLGLGHLPGDVSATRGGVTFAFPVVTCIVVSLVLTIVVNVILSLRR